MRTQDGAARLDLEAGLTSGTVLLVEDMDRFSRLQIDEGIDLLRSRSIAGYVSSSVARTGMTKY